MQEGHAQDRARLARHNLGVGGEISQAGGIVQYHTLMRAENIGEQGQRYGRLREVTRMENAYRIIPNGSFSLNGPLLIVWQEQPARLRPGIFDDHAHEAGQQTVEVRLGSNSLRGFEETRHVKRVGAHATGVGYGSKVRVAGLEVCDFGVRAPAGVGGARVTQASRR